MNPFALARPGVLADCRRLARHLDWLEARLIEVCTNAGEYIARTVSDVEGLYVKAPSPDANRSFVRYHEADGRASSWVAPLLGRHYSFVELASRASGGIDHSRQELTAQEKGNPKWQASHRTLDRPSAKFGVTWRRIGEKVDLRRGIYGDETVVFEVASGEVLAVRRVYYYELRPHSVDETGRTLISPHWRTRFRSLAKGCTNYRPKDDPVHWDREPRDSYEFVARVLNPKMMSNEAARSVFDLARGSGEKYGGCTIATFGPRIGPEDLRFIRIGDDGLKIKIKRSADSLYCARFYGKRDRVFYRFYDGRIWRRPDVERATQLNSPMLQPVRPAAVEVDEPDLRFNRLGRPATAADLVADCRNLADELASSPKREDCERLDRHIRWLEARLAAMCADAGERIMRTVDNVEGLLIQRPASGADYEFHSERDYMSPLQGRHYTLWEYQWGGRVEQRRLVATTRPGTLPRFTTTRTSVDSPSARYGITWTSIGDPAEQRHGLHGDETTIFETASGAILASRRIYYYSLRPNLLDRNGRALQSPHWTQKQFPPFVQTCRNYQLTEDWRYKDLRPRDSYDFVSRVLRPRPPPHDVALDLFVLARGSGRKESASCTFVSFGPRISPEDLELSHVEPHGIRITIRGTLDSLLCPGYYRPAMRDLAHQATTWRFYDHTTWDFNEVDRRAKLRAGILTAAVDAHGSSHFPAARSPGQPGWPSIEPGLWKLKVQTNGRKGTDDYCGDPLKDAAEDLSEQAFDGLGCTITDVSTTSQSLNRVIECPDAAAKDGSRHVERGRIEVKVSLPSPDSFTFHVHSSPDGYRELVVGVRTGACYR